MATTNNLNISVVVPLYNEEESLPELHAWIRRVMTANNYTYEIIFVDDGSSDNSWNVVRSLQRRDSNIRGIRFRRNYGKSAALYCGFEAARGEVVITMDADLQDSPDEIPDLYRMIKLERYDLVSGWKKRRHDPLGKTLPSKFFNFCARLASGIKLHDFNCGLKAYRNKVIKSIEVYGEMHRFIPLLAKSAGFRHIGEKVVHHQARKYGKSKFGWERMIKGYLDLITVMFMSKFGKSPMYFFGGLGTLMFLVGGGTTIALIAEKLYKQAHLLPIRGVTEQPLFFIAITAVIIGVQLFLAGFIGELINRNSGERNRYLIDERLEASSDQNQGAAPTPRNSSDSTEHKDNRKRNQAPAASASEGRNASATVADEGQESSRGSRNRSRRGKFDKNRNTAVKPETRQAEATEAANNAPQEQTATGKPAQGKPQSQDASATSENTAPGKPAPEVPATSQARTTPAKETLQVAETKPASEAPAKHQPRTPEKSQVVSEPAPAPQSEAAPAKEQPAAPAERDLFSM